MKYKNPIVSGLFIKRLNRFIAEVEIEGKIELVHVRNTGRLTELLIPQTKVFLEESTGEKRKTKYSLISIYKGNKLVNLDTQIVNYVFEEAVRNNQIDFLINPEVFLSEKVYNHSRFDFYYEIGKRKGFIELKGVTLEKDSITMFPGSPTTRGRKHVKELIQGAQEGFENYIIFLIQIEGTKSFRTFHEMDPLFSEAMKEAVKKGVKVLAFDTIISKDTITLNKKIPVKI